MKFVARKRKLACGFPMFGSLSRKYEVAYIPRSCGIFVYSEDISIVINKNESSHFCVIICFIKSEESNKKASRSLTYFCRYMST
ncbi:hypothetical protein GDO81_018670 [Engystomops pustulosus]|uniref:Uncharacterized protein n=1 Tax=Engystomops pustulosus TaxID=76066 RepID=A0AAV6YD68_ENGPU|nr:hypothetical protein GDO81_018670 [Engystomops pustulosus]